MMRYLFQALTFLLSRTAAIVAAVAAIASFFFYRKRYAYVLGAFAAVVFFFGGKIADVAGIDNPGPAASDLDGGTLV